MQRNDTSSTKHVIASVPEPTAIKIADKPLSAGGIVRTISPEEFKNQFNCEYTENLYTSLPWNKPTQVQPVDNPNNFVICFINEKIGYGLCTEQSIAANQQIMLYGGILSSTKENGDEYCFRILNNHFISSKKVGGYARFISHFAYDNEFDFYDSTIDKNEKVCAPNVQVVYDQDGILKVITTKDIPKNSILGYSYGRRYWINRGLPGLLSPEGELIPQHKYYWNEATFSFCGNVYRIKRTEIINRNNINSFKTKPLDQDSNDHLSWFKLREELVKIKFIPPQFGHLDSCYKETISLLEEKCNHLPLTVKAFYHKPPIESKELKMGEKIDIVCWTNSKKNFNALVTFFQPLNKIKFPIKKNWDVNEIVLEAINHKIKGESSREILNGFLHSRRST